MRFFGAKIFSNNQVEQHFKMEFDLRDGVFFEKDFVGD